MSLDDIPIMGHDSVSATPPAMTNNDVKPPALATHHLSEDEVKDLLNDLPTRSNAASVASPIKLVIRHSTTQKPDNTPPSTEQPRPPSTILPKQTASPIEHNDDLDDDKSPLRQSTIIHGSLKTSGVLSRSWDFYDVEKNEAISRAIAKKGKGPEKIIFSGFETKVNRRKRKQRRLLVITEKALYNIGSPDYCTIKRRILLHKITAISCCESSREFVIHVFDEYDYRFRSEKVELIVDILGYEYKRVARRNLEVLHVEKKDLDGITLTRVMALQADKRQKSRQELIALVGSDNLGRVTKKSDPPDPRETVAMGISIYELEVVETNNKRLEDFEILKVIGRGALGKVVLVQENESKKLYAMKILKKSTVYDKNQMEHVRTEREIMETFQYPFLVGLKYAFQNETRLYLVMDFYKGGELYFHLQKKKRFVEDEVRILAAEVALGLGHLHSLGYAYRDLKPENVLMDDKGHVVLTDFNTVRKFETREERAFSFIGTPEYVAPEVIRCTGHTTSVDWWCLGVLIYELTNGVTPFVASTVDAIYDKVLNQVDIKYPPRMSEELVDLISKLLNRDPEKRLGAGPKDVEEIKQHRFFKSIKWDRVISKEIIPVYRPPLEKPEDLTVNFKNELVSESVTDSYAPSNKNLAEAEEFKRWTYNEKSRLKEKPTDKKKEKDMVSTGNKKGGK